MSKDEYVQKRKEEIKAENDKIKSLETQLNTWRSKAGKLEFQLNKALQQLEDKELIIGDEAVSVWTMRRVDGVYQALEYKLIGKKLVEIVEHEPNYFPIVEAQITREIFKNTYGQ